MATTKIRSSSITDGQVANADLSATVAVTGGQIADDAVTLAKMAGLVRGKIIVGDASGDPSALTVGGANTVLTSDGTDAAWAASAVGGKVLQVVQTVKTDTTSTTATLGSLVDMTGMTVDITPSAATSKVLVFWKALDPELIGSVLESIKSLVADGMTMVIVTHEIGFAKEVGDWIIYMDEGQVVEAGPPEIIGNPKTERMKKFLGQILEA